MKSDIKVCGLTLTLSTNEFKEETYMISSSYKKYLLKTEDEDFIFIDLMETYGLNDFSYPIPEYLRIYYKPQDKREALKKLKNDLLEYVDKKNRILQ